MESYAGTRPPATVERRRRSRLGGIYSKWRVLDGGTFWIIIDP